MIFLAEFDVIQPDFGLFFWSFLFFILFWVLIGGMAFKPISKALTKRSRDIEDSLNEAKLAEQRVQNIKAENEKILAEAREERAKILKESKEHGAKIVAEAKEASKVEANKIMVAARQEISNMRAEAAIELKNQVGVMAVDIAEKILQQELSGNKQSELVNRLVSDIQLN